MNYKKRQLIELIEESKHNNLLKKVKKELRKALELIEKKGIKQDKIGNYKLPVNSGKLSEKEYVQELFKINQCIRPKEFRLAPVKARVLQGKIKPLSCIDKGEIKGYESHSGRALWIKKIHKIGMQWFPGIEYKGVRKLQSGLMSKYLWGGAKLDKVINEYNYNLEAWKAGVKCQVPLGIYQRTKELGVLVRTFKSPIRLFDFIWIGFFDKYLIMRYGSKDIKAFTNYIRSLARTYKNNLKKLTSIGLVHCSLSTTNITSEGEFADFEQANPVTNEGIIRTNKPHYKDLMIKRLIDGMKYFCKRINYYNELDFNKKEAMNVYEKELKDLK